MRIPDIKQLVKSTRQAKFLKFEDRKLWYRQQYFTANGEMLDFDFPIAVSETDGATFLPEDRPIFFMRWMREHLDYLRGAQANPSAGAPSGRPVPSRPGGCESRGFGPGGSHDK